MEIFDNELPAPKENMNGFYARHAYELSPRHQEMLDSFFGDIDRLASRGMILGHTSRDYTRESDCTYAHPAFYVSRVTVSGENGFDTNNPNDLREVPDDLHLGRGPISELPGYSVNIGNFIDYKFRYHVDERGFHRFDECDDFPYFENDDETIDVDEGDRFEEFRERQDTLFEAEELFSANGMLRPSKPEIDALHEAISLWEAYPWDAEDVPEKFSLLIADAAIYPSASEHDELRFRQLIDEVLAAEETQVSKQRKYSLPDGQDVFLYIRHKHFPDGRVVFTDFSMAIRRLLADSSGYQRMRLEYLPDQHIAQVRYSTEVMRDGYGDRLTDTEANVTEKEIEVFKSILEQLTSATAAVS